MMRTVIQCVWEVFQGSLKMHPTAPLYHPNNGYSTLTPAPSSWTSKITDAQLFNQGWMQRFQGLFHEYKVHRITAHYIPYASIEMPGLYVFSLADASENAELTSAKEAIGMPSSVVRPSRSPAKLNWYPTEPADRNWQTFGDKHEWCFASIYSFEEEYKLTVPQETGATEPEVKKIDANIAGKIVIEVDASFRGKPKQPTPAKILRSISTSEEPAPHCCCKRCLQGLDIFKYHNPRTSTSVQEEMELVASPPRGLRD